MESALAAACCFVGLLLAAPSPTPTARAATPTPKPVATATHKPAATATPKPAPTATPLPSPTPLPTATPRPDIGAFGQALIGRSQELRDISAYALGSGPIKVAFVGGMHGAPEANTAWLVWELMYFFEAQPEVIPSTMTLLFLPEANPDGLANGVRELADGVDPNRNWPTPDWSPSSFGPHGPRQGGGGLVPMSEPETVTLANWILSTQPTIVVSYHSAGGLVMGGSSALSLGLVDAYLAGARGYVYRDWIYYPVTGDFAQWCESLGIPTVEIELWDHFDPDVERNLAGVLTVLQAVEAILAQNAPY